MQVYTYSEARQKLAAVLDKAESVGGTFVQNRVPVARRIAIP